MKIINKREEEFVSTVGRHPMKVTVKVGVKKDGAIVAREGKVLTDNGAYNDECIIATMCVASRITLLYRVPNIKTTVNIAYTNKPYGGAFRGFGGPQAHWAMESQMDMVAEKLGIDPMELRLRNANQPNDVTVSGYRITSCGLSECIKQAADAAGWKDKRGKLGPNRGIGMAVMVHTGGGAKLPPINVNYSDAIVRLNDDGTATILTGEADIGQGSDTIIAQIVAEQLGMAYEEIKIVSADTGITPKALGTWGTRVTFTGGKAAQIAAGNVKKEIFEEASEMLEANVNDLEARNGRVYVKGSPQKHVSFKDIVIHSYSTKGKPIIGRGYFGEQISDPPSPTGTGSIYPAYAFGAQIAEVEVNPKTGQVKLLNFVAAHDVGKAINPMACEGQIEGGIQQGIGYALTENLMVIDGVTVNPNFLDYKILFAPDMPPMKTILVETNDPNGPFGAKGLGEPCMVPTAPAIANAIYDAVGVRIKDLPITPEKILKALEDKKKLP